MKSEFVLVQTFSKLFLRIDNSQHKAWSFKIYMYSKYVLIFSVVALKGSSLY